MSTLGKKLLTKEMQWTANMTELNHLGAALLAKPYKLQGKMDTLFSAQNYYSDNPLMSKLIGVGEETIPSMEWEYDIKGANCRPLVVVEDVMPSSDLTRGKFKRSTKLKLDKNWWVAGDIITPGTSGKKYQARIEKDPERHGKGWVYTIRLMSDDPKAFIPAKFFRQGSKWGKLFSKYAEATEQSGSTQFSLPISMKGRMSKYRKKYKITDYASDEVLAVAVPDSNGKYHESWMRYAEVEYFMQWYRELERGLWYSRSTDTVLDHNGRPVRSGPGIQEQLEESHIHRYTHLTTNLIEEYLMDIFYNRIKPGSRKEIVGYTGEYGLIQFHRAVQDWVNKGGFIKNVEVYTDKVKSPYHSNALSAGVQYIRYEMANGASLRLVHNPLYDDTEINFEIDEVTGYPVESQRITFLDFSGEGQKSNIKLMRRKDSYAFAYICGMYTPYGPSQKSMNKGMAAHAGDFYEMHVREDLGTHIGDPTKCGELILGRN